MEVHCKAASINVDLLGKCGMNGKSEFCIMATNKYIQNKTKIRIFKCQKFH